MSRIIVTRVAGIFAAAALLSASTGESRASADTASDATKVVQAASEALYQMYAIGAPSAMHAQRRADQYVTSPPGAVSDLSPAHAPDSVELDARLTRARDVLRSVFGDASQDLVARIELAIRNTDAAAREPELCLFGSGLSSLETLETAIDGDTAVVRLRATVWSAFQHEVRPGAWEMATPSEVELFTASAAKDQTGRWRIVDLVGIPEAPGLP